MTSPTHPEGDRKTCPVCKCDLKNAEERALRRPVQGRHRLNACA